jgi:hypothetical protein
VSDRQLRHLHTSWSYRRAVPASTCMQPNTKEGATSDNGHSSSQTVHRDWDTGCCSCRILLHLANYLTQIIFVSRWASKRSQWPRGLRRGFAAARLLGSRVRIPPGVWLSVCCECCLLSCKRLCDWPSIHPEESYRVCCVPECDREASIMRRPWPTGGCGPTGGCCAIGKKK